MPHADTHTRWISDFGLLNTQTSLVQRLKFRCFEGNELLSNSNNHKIAQYDSVIKSQDWICV